jgi:hypothetical protein
VRRTNLALLALLPLVVLIGVFANTIGTDWAIDPAQVHGAAALAMAAVTPWKSVVVRRGLRRRRTRAGWSMLLLGLVLVALASGLAHATGLIGAVGPLTIMQIHVGAGLAAVAFLAAHVRMHPVRPRRVDLDRRAALRFSGLAVAGATLALGWERVLVEIGLPGARRRFTGSHERGSGDPAAMPVTSWLDDRVPAIDPEWWRVDIAGTTVGLDTLGGPAAEDVEAILDCTGGWFSAQTWRGVRLDRLVDGTGWASVVVTSATGYTRRFPITDLDRLWLCTAVGGEPLSAGHGSPARLVAPDRRGFWWVKWVVSITPSPRPWWVQPPFPLT